MADFTYSSFKTHKMESHIMHILWDMVFCSVLHNLHIENPYNASSVLIAVHAEIIGILCHFKLVPPAGVFSLD